MINSKSLVSVPNWISCRQYVSSIGERRTIILNNRDRELLTLDGISSALWGLIVESEEDGVSIEVLASKMVAPNEEVATFLIELFSAGLLKIDGDCNSYIAAQTSHDADSSLIPILASTGHTEAAPGGGNSQTELDFQEWVTNNGFLWAFTWELTYRCNESCVHCFNPGASHGDDEKSNRKTEELSLDEIKRVLDELASLGVFRLLLTGGEILVRRDIYQILEYAFEKRFALTLYTNGVLVDAKAISFLSEKYPSRIELSLYSHIAEIHDKVTRLPSSWERTMSAVRELKRVGLLVSIKLIAMRENEPEIEGFWALCEEEGVPGQVDFNLSPGVDGSRRPIENQKSSGLHLIQQALDPRTPLYVGEKNNPRKFDPSKLIGQRVCGAGVAGMSLSPEGNIYPCNSLPIYSGNVRQNSLTEIWSGSMIGSKRINSPTKTDPDSDVMPLTKWQGVVRGDYEVCGTFNRCGWCQKCPGMGYLETGSELKPSTTNCRNASARLIAYEYFIEKDQELKKDVSIYEISEKFPVEWGFLSQDSEVAATISLSDVQKILKTRTRAKALQSISPLGERSLGHLASKNED